MKKLILIVTISLLFGCKISVVLDVDKNKLTKENHGKTITSIIDVEITKCYEGRDNEFPHKDLLEAKSKIPLIFGEGVKFIDCKKKNFMTDVATFSFPIVIDVIKDNVIEGNKHNHMTLYYGKDLMIAMPKKMKKSLNHYSKNATFDLDIYLKVSNFAGVKLFTYGIYEASGKNLTPFFGNFSFNSNKTSYLKLSDVSVDLLKHNGSTAPITNAK